MLKILYILSFISFLTSCSMDQIIQDNLQNMAKAMDQAINSQVDLAQVKEGLPSLLLQMDGFLEMAPEDEDLWVQASKLNCLFGIGFLEKEAEERARLLYEKGQGYAVKVLSRKDGFPQSGEGKIQKWESFLQSLQKDDVPAIFWAAQCMAARIRLSSDSPDSLADISKVESMMKRVLELDEKFYFAGAHLFWGMYLAKSKEAGGDLVKSKSHFDRLAELTDSQYLLGLYYFAETYCVQSQNEALFTASLQRILQSSVSSDPRHLRLMNQLAREKARLLWKKKEELFL